MKLIELLPLIECSTVNVYEKRKYRPSRFIALINPKKNKGCISDDLLDREIYSISISCNRNFIIFVCDDKEDEELVKKAVSIGLVEDVNNDDSNEDDDFLMIEERIDKLIKTYQMYIDQNNSIIISEKDKLIRKLNDASYENIQLNAKDINVRIYENDLFRAFIGSLEYAKTGEIK